MYWSSCLASITSKSHVVLLLCRCQLHPDDKRYALQSFYTYRHHKYSIYCTALAIKHSGMWSLQCLVLHSSLSQRTKQTPWPLDQVLHYIRSGHVLTSHFARSFEMQNPASLNKNSNANLGYYYTSYNVRLGRKIIMFPSLI